MRILQISLIAIALSSFAVDTVAQPPDSSLATAIKPLREYISKRNYEEALSYVHNVERRGEFIEHVPILLCEIAFMAGISEKHDVVKRSALEVIEKYPQSPYVRLAWCHLGDAHQGLGGHDKMIEAYEKGLDGFRAEPNKHVSRALVSAEEAHVLLGNHYMARREWSKGLACWEHWQPDSFCGTCLDGMESGRKVNIWLCKLHLGRHDEFARDTLNRLRGNAMEPATGGTYLAYLTYRLYAQAGQQEGLLAVARLAQAKESEYITRHKIGPLSERMTATRFAGHAVVYCEKLQMLSENDRFQDLVDILSGAEEDSDPSESNRQDWPLRAAAHALARKGPRVVPLIERNIGTRDNPSGREENWLYYALARNPFPEAQNALSRVKLGENAWHTKVNSLYLALSLKKELKLDDLQQFASNVRSLKSRYDRQMVYCVEQLSVENDWPAPKKGSLPGEFDLGNEPLEELLKK